jgi:cytochrome c553
VSDRKQKGKPPGIKVQRLLLILLIASALAGTTTALSAADVEANWDKDCKACHGTDGKWTDQWRRLLGSYKSCQECHGTDGRKQALKDFTDASFQATFTDAQATKAIKEGLKDGDKTKMKAYTDLTDDEVKALVAKVRGFKK